MNLINRLILEDYRKQRNDFISLGDTVHAMLDEICNDTGIVPLGIEHRVKKEKSLARKFERSGGWYSTLEDLTDKEAFYMATMGGGKFFGKAGSFEKGYKFDAVILNDSKLLHPQKLSIAERLERAVYLSLDITGGIVGKCVDGTRVI